jgi:hypothetical protein
MQLSNSVHGCDHHGAPAARQPCGCDFCRGGEALRAAIWAKKLKSQAARGLESSLQRGPDPRSLNAAGVANMAMRQAFYSSLGVDHAVGL